MNSATTSEHAHNNDLFPNPTELCALVDGTYQTPADALSATKTIRSVAIDSRLCSEGSLFFALAGESSDGERYVSEAFDAGAVLAVVRHERDPSGRPWNGPVIVVDDTLHALHQLSAWYVDTYLADTIRIGVTGSNGKTTTKEFIVAGLSERFEVYGSQGNYNSETGVPLAVFSTPPHVPVAVYEMAMSAAGEMESLAYILRPVYAVITNIGNAHIGRLGSRDAIASEKKMIAHRFTGSETLLIYENDDYADYLADGIRGEIVSFGPKAQHAEILTDADGVRIRFRSGETVSLPIAGRHNGLNALAAIRLVELLGGSIGDLDTAMWVKNLPEGRSQRVALAAGGVVLHDAYNANPDSMHAALDMIDEIHRVDHEAKPLVLVLGDMRELGDYTASAHTDVLEHALRLHPDTVYLVGDEFTSAVSRIFPSFDKGRTGKRWQYDGITVWCVPTVRKLVHVVADTITGHEVVLLKGSRAMELETILPVLTRRKGAKVV